MLVLFTVNHPSQFHMFKILANILVNDGNKVIFFIQDRGIIKDLIIKSGFKYKLSMFFSFRNVLKGKIGITIRGILSLIQEEILLFFFNLFHKVDFMLGTDISITHIGRLFNRPAFVFTDDDYYIVKTYSSLAFPYAKCIFASTVCDVGKWENKKIAYLGTQKSMYLHPKYFVPDEKILQRYNLKNKRYFLIRLVSFNALHDVLHDTDEGINEKNLSSLIELLEKYGQVIINTEGKISEKYKAYTLNINPEDIHNILYYADLFIGESQSMTIESALLGTPAIRMNKWVVNKNRINIIDHLEKEYGFCYNIAPGDFSGLLKTCEILLKNNSKEKWKGKRNQFFKENTNLTDFLYWFIKNYPESIKDYKTALNKFNSI